MWRLSRVFVDIALHRRGPDELPASQFLFGLVWVLYLAVGLAALQIGTALRFAAAMLLFDSVLYLALVWLLLKSFGKPRRFLQTGTALIGTDVLMNLIAVPLLLWNEALAAPATETTPPQVLFLLLFVWSLDVAGYVLSKALEKPYFVGVAIVIVYVSTSAALREAFFPVGS